MSGSNQIASWVLQWIAKEKSPEWHFEALADDVTRRDQWRQCHKCRKWQPCFVFYRLPPIECRPICSNCQSINESESPA